MNKENDIVTIVWKYIKEESTQNEFNIALQLFSNPYFNIGLKTLLTWFWEKEAAINLKRLPSKNEYIMLQNIHLRMNNPVSGKYCKYRKLSFSEKVQYVFIH